MRIFKKTELETSQWSGGTTTQLAIYPENAIYADRNFTWRVSTAKVDLEESSFTSLPGVYRHLMILDGSMQITHQGHYTKHLNCFDQDNFQGDWTTKSVGKVTDFNLMITSGEGKIEAMDIKLNSAIQIRAVSSSEYESASCVIYFLSDMEVTNGNENLHVNNGDVIVLNNKDAEVIKIINKNAPSAKIVLAHIQHDS